MAKKHKPPSRIRYEENHPTFSVRIPKPLYDQLKELCKDGGWSFADFARQALNEQKPVAKQIRKRLDAAWATGYDAGFKNAKAQYLITFPCFVCKKPIEIASSDTGPIKAVQEALAGWRHKTCIPKPVKDVSGGKHQ